MTEGYAAFDDPYIYPGTTVLRNRLDLRDPHQLDAFEVEMTMARAAEPLPVGRFGPAHYRRLHRHLFQDVYGWAGRYRTVRTAKGDNVFCYPEHIPAQMDRLFASLAAPPFTGGTGFDPFIQAAAGFLGELNAIHPFREGNGRVQLLFLNQVAERAGHPLNMGVWSGTAFSPP
jgi:cell filamentation protein